MHLSYGRVRSGVMTKRIVVAMAVLVSCVWFGVAGEKSFSWTYAPGQGDNIAIRMNVYSLGKYLAQLQVNRPEIVSDVRDLLAEGGYYRKRTKDQKGEGTILTVYVDKDYMLHIVTFRNETCDKCKGTGKRAAPFDGITNKVAVKFNCLECKGEGKLKDTVTERYYILSPEDFENAEEGRAILAQKAYADAPQGAESWVERLVSANPRERLEACLWLDKNYVRTGAFFQDIMPMLKKARYYDQNDKRKIMVWQFWAGKDMPEERNRAYYRIYADSKSGKITEKGFYAGK